MKPLNRTDLIGGSDGYRVPGYSIAIEPGISLAWGKNLFAITAPVAIERHTIKSIPDMRTGNPVAPVAALADFMITASFSRRF